MKDLYPDANQAPGDTWDSLNGAFTMCQLWVANKVAESKPVTSMINRNIRSRLRTIETA